MEKEMFTETNIKKTILSNFKNIDNVFFRTIQITQKRENQEYGKIELFFRKLFRMRRCYTSMFDSKVLIMLVGKKNVVLTRGEIEKIRGEIHKIKPINIDGDNDLVFSDLNSNESICFDASIYKKRFISDLKLIN